MTTNLNPIPYRMGTLAQSALNMTREFDLPIQLERGNALRFLRDRFDNIIEEVREFKVEVDRSDLELAVEELVDLVYLSTQTLCQLDDDLVNYTIARIVEKNNDKNTVTHHQCFDGKVRPINHKDCKCAS